MTTQGTGMVVVANVWMRHVTALAYFYLFGIDIKALCVLPARNDARWAAQDTRAEVFPPEKYIHHLFCH